MIETTPVAPVPRGEPVDAAIITAIAPELAPITTLWGYPRPEERVLHQGTLTLPDGTHRRVVALATGYGTVAGALGLAGLLRVVSPIVIVAGGIAGGIDRGAIDAGTDGECAPGDLVIAEEVGFYDRDLSALGGKPWTLAAPCRPDPEAVADRLRMRCPVPGSPAPGGPAPGGPAPRGSDALPATDGRLHGHDAGCIRSGLVLTGDSFLDARLLQELPYSWRARISEARAVDMESAAWATVADRAGIPWTVLRVISDGVFTGRKRSFREASRAAGEALREIAKIILSDSPEGCYHTE